MTEKRLYGTWDSPISAQMVADGLRVDDVQWDDDGETVVWQERRAHGGTLVMQRGTQATRDLTDSTLSVGGKVGYGGGGFCVRHGVVYFVAGGRLYRHSLDGGFPQAITPKVGGAASPVASPDGEWIAYVHTDEGNDRLLVVDSSGKQYPQILASGDDFVMQPAWHPEQTHLAFVAWNYPNMPWNGTELRLVTLAPGVNGEPVVTGTQVIAGDEQTSIFQPEFSPDGRYLSYISDASGWTHLMLFDLQTGEHRQLTSGEIELGTPAWVQGMRTYGWTADRAAIYTIVRENNQASLWIYDMDHETHLPVHELDPYTFMEQISVSPTGESIAMIAGAGQIATRVIRYSAIDGVRVIRRTTTENIPVAYLADAEPITWRGHDGDDVHGFYHAPTNPLYEGTGKPPLIIFIHGGPTSHHPQRLEMKFQFWTSRGFALLAVNHRGSTGHGKDYMNKHAGQWGVYDVKDSVTGAQYLAEQGLVDPDKVVIMGGSAGGYTVLQALVDHPDFFKAGIANYGIGNQFALIMDTHKFEARYSEWLLGSLPESAAVWRDRSPLFKAGDIRSAVALFHGEDDPVVPVSESRTIYQTLQRKGVTTELHTYAGEGHGFSQAKTIIDYHENALRFLQVNVVYS